MQEQNNNSRTVILEKLKINQTYAIKPCKENKNNFKQNLLG